MRHFGPLRLAYPLHMVSNMTEQAATETPNATETYTIPAVNLPTLEDKVAKLARKAHKLGMSAPTLTKSDIYPVELTRVNRHSGKKETYTISKVDVSITHPVLHIGGYTFLCALDHPRETGGENVIRAHTPGDYHTQWGNAGPDCTHCNTRRYRKETYVLQGEDGSVVQVGSTCIRDFIGIDAENALRLAQFVAECASVGGEPTEGWGACRQDYYDLIELLTFSSLSIRLCGWTSKGKAYENEKLVSTSSDVSTRMMWYDNPPTGRDRVDPAEYTPTTEDHTSAQQALEWAKILTVEECAKSDYLQNLRVIANRGYAEFKQKGIAVSMQSAYLRAQERLVYAKREAKRREGQNPQHVGTVGKREIFSDITLVRMSGWDTQYGYTHLHVFENADGSEIVWKGSKRLRDSEGEVAVGTTVSVKGTCKKHDTYKGRPQTYINRVVLQ